MTDLDNWRIDDMFTPSLPWKVITWELSPALSEGDNCLLISSLTDGLHSGVCLIRHDLT